MTPCASARPFVLALSLLCGVTAATAQAQEPLPVLARIGPWPAISRLIGFGDRLWFANSVKGVNHNSADLYSYDPETNNVRYERHLFSQDAGEPLVAGGLLYWPFEDARFSTGVGHFMVTDDATWRFGTIPTARIFHTHAMAASGARLIAATSAWRAGLQVSDDGGATWRQAYDHQTPEGQVTRIVKLTALGDRVFGYLIGRDQQRLLRLDEWEITEVPGWPKDRAVLGLTRFADHVYGAVRTPEGVALWRTDGTSSSEVSPPRLDLAVRALAADRDALWALTGDDRGGALWRSPEGAAWRLTHTLVGGRPFDLAIHRGNVYVGGAGDDGRGMLWGTSAPADPNLEPQRTPPKLTGGRTAERDWAAAGAALDEMLADPASYTRPTGLRALIYELAFAGPPEHFFATRLHRQLPTDEISLIGGNVQVPITTFGRWLLLWGMSIAGQGQVPVELLEEPWTAPENPAEKYFDTPPAAMWTATLLGQDDPATIDALMGRLGRADDPLWLRGDAIGALSELTGQRFGYEVEAWQAWWTLARGRRPG